MEETIINEDARIGIKRLEDKSCRCCVTSPPYFNLRDYGIDGQMGLERRVSDYVRNMVEFFRLVWDKLADDGTLWLNLGDTYAGYWGDARAKAEQRPSSADEQWVRGFHMNTRPDFDHLRSEGFKQKDLLGIPWRVAMALQADGWYLRDCIVWVKPNPMPESVRDRFTKAYEFVFLLSKQPKYFFDAKSVREPAQDAARNPYDCDFRSEATITARTYPVPSGWDMDSGSHGNFHKNGRRPGPRFGGNKYGDSKDPKHATKSGRRYVPTGFRNKRNVWVVPVKPFKGNHFATFPPDLVVPCIKAGSAPGDLVLDPFAGSGTTIDVALTLGRRAIGFEINPESAQIARDRIKHHTDNLLTKITTT